jgi:tRNA(Ile)-lysidine synthetase-like protein
MDTIEKIHSLEQLYDWWFSSEASNNWFNSTPSNDEIISNKFGYMLTNQTDNPEEIFIKYEKIISDTTNTNSIKPAIGFILLFDQIFRHWVRHNQYDIELIGLIGHKLTESNVYKTFYQTNKHNLNNYDFCFTLLPLRHSNDYDKIKFVLKETWGKLDEIKGLENNESEGIYIKYLKATYERAGYKFVNEKEFHNTDYSDKPNSINLHENIEQFVSKYSDVLDSQSMYSYSTNYKNYNPDSCSIAQECLRIPKSTPLIVSISGGVDSMVVSWVLKKLGYNIVFVHINYSNRSNTDLEQDMVESWGNYLGVRVFYRKLDEINRPKCMEYELRNIYETYTRDQRYHAYTQTAKIMGWTDYKVVLGHNHDDCIENIFTNITSKTKYENLYGMEFNSYICFDKGKINFVRPMLNVPKQVIYQVAKENNIMFLWDSTPKWSQRGKLRDLVRPALLEFNSEVLEGFNELVKVLNQSMECVDLLVNGFYDKIINMEIQINIKELNDKKIFWDKLLTKLNINVSSKCLNSLIEKINRFKTTFDTKDLNSVELFQLNKNKRIGFSKKGSDVLTIVFR